MSSIQPGSKFERWTVLSYAGHGPNSTHWWNCQCVCGTQARIRDSSLASGNSRSCGCLQREVTRKRSLVHGAVRRIAGKRVFTPEYKIWQRMKERCYNSKCVNFARYGGRGIQVCLSWRRSFSAFYQDMGPRPPGTSIERKDNQGDYTPENCVWATPLIQSNNKRSNFRINIDGRTQTLAEWGRETGVKASTIRYRLQHGWSAKDAVFQKVKLR